MQEGEDLPEGEDKEKPQKAPKNQITLVDQYTGTSHSFQDSMYLLLITENVCSQGFISAVLIAVLAAGTLVLVIIEAFKDKQDGNRRDIPTNSHPWGHPIQFSPQGCFSATTGNLVGVHRLKMILPLMQEWV